MPKRPITRAPYVEHADAYAVRPALNGKQYFLGYWPTEAMAIDAGNQFKKLAALDDSPEYLAQVADELKALARAKRDEDRTRQADDRAEKAARKQPRKRVHTVLEQHEREINTLHQRINELERRIAK